jgi:hypothetical protein
MKKVDVQKLGDLLKKFQLHEIIDIKTLNGDLFKGSIGQFEKSKQFHGSEELDVKELSMTITEFEHDYYPTLIIVLNYKIKFNADIQNSGSE